MSYLWNLAEHIDWGEVLKSSYGGKPQRDGTIFFLGGGGVDPPRHYVNILIWQLEEGYVERNS